SIRAGELIGVALVLKLEGLADFTRREIEAPDQRAVVAVVFRIRTVAGVALAAPPAFDAGAAIPECRVVNPAFDGGNRTRDGAVGQGQIVAVAGVAGKGTGRISDDADKVVRQS